MKTKLNAMIDEKFVSLIDKAAEQRDRSKSYIVNQALREYFERREKKEKRS